MRANIGGRLMYLYRFLTHERHNFSGGKWDQFLKAQQDRKQFQAFIAARLNRLHPDQAELMDRYYVKGEPADNIDRVRSVELRKAFAAHISAREVARLEELMQHG